MSAPAVKVAPRVRTPRVSFAQNRLVECAAFAWIAGLSVAYATTAATTGIGAVVGCAGGLLALGLLLLRVVGGCKRNVLLVCAIGFALAVATWSLYRVRVRDPQLALDGQTLVLDAKIADLRTYENGRVRYTLDTQLNGHSATLEWYADAEQQVEPLRIADRVTLSATLGRAGAKHPDAARAAAGRGVYLTVMQATVMEHHAATGFSLRRLLRDYRAYLTDSIARRLPPAEAGLLLAMLFGEKNALSDAVAEALYHTGIGHITAVSGLHLVFFCTLLAAILRRLRVGARWVFLSTVAAALLFSMLVEQSVSIARAAVMLLLSQSAGLFGRYPDTLRSLSLAMVACTLFSPYVIGSASFWLSVSGVFGIGVVARAFSVRLRGKGRWRRQVRRRVNRAVRQLLPLICVSVTVFPASVFFCGETSLLAPLGNLFLLPLAGLALNIGLLMVCTGGLAAFLLPLAGLLCRLVTTLATMLAAVPFSHLSVETPAVRLTMLCGVGLVLLMALATRRRMPTATAALVVALVLTLQTAALRLRGWQQLQLATLGTRTELALVMEANGYTCVVDETCALENAEAVGSYLAARGISRVDALILRSDAHASAYQTALAGCAVEAVFLLGAETLRPQQMLCACQPQRVGDTLSLQMGAATLCCAPQATTLQWRDFSVCSVRAGLPTTQTASAVIRYGGLPAADDCCGIWLVPMVDDHLLSAQGYGDSNNWFLCVTKAGNASVAALSNE